MPITAKLERSLTYSKPNEDQVARILRLREAAKVFGASIETEGKPSREQSLAITKLEEALMWATKGVVLEEATEVRLAYDGKFPGVREVKP